MTGSLSGKTAFVTAAGQGIGRATAPCKKGVDGGPSPAMTGRAWSVPRLMQLSRPRPSVG
jgi:hypothetical protein